MQFITHNSLSIPYLLDNHTRGKNLPKIPPNDQHILRIRSEFENPKDLKWKEKYFNSDKFGNFIELET